MQGIRYPSFTQPVVRDRRLTKSFRNSHDQECDFLLTCPHAFLAPTTMKLKYYDRYAQQMLSLGRGLALWEPEPDNKYKRVEIGDVGHMLSGHFLRLFNATLPIGDQRNSRGVPDGYEPLSIDQGDTYVESLPARQPLWSSDVRVFGANIEFSTDLPVAGPGASMQANIMTSSGNGAMLLTGHEIVSEDAASLRIFESYIKRHHESWLSFAKKLGRKVELEDLILVTGRHVTEDFAMLTFSEASRDAEIAIKIGLPSIGSGHAAFHVSCRHITSPDINYGPRTLSLPDTPLSDNQSQGSQDDVGKSNQCVFLRGYRIKKRLGFVKMKAAAGPHVLESEGREKEYEPLRSADSESSSDDLELISDTTRTTDPTHLLLRYILTNSEASLAVVHDNDLGRMYRNNYIGLQEDLEEALCRLSPQLEIKDGVGRFKLEGTLSKPIIGDASHQLQGKKEWKDSDISHLTKKIDLRDGELSLQDAAVRGSVEVVRMLLDGGADVNSSSLYGQTPLQNAVSHGRDEVVRMLLDRGANVNARGHKGSPLVLAASRGHSSIVGILLDSGADVNAHSTFWSTALQQAASRGHDEVVRMLLDKGADVHACLHGEIPLFLAASEGHASTVELLLHGGAYVDAPSTTGRTSLLEAASHGRDEVVKMLLDRGADVNARGSEGNALVSAASKGHASTVGLLLISGADVNSRSPKGYTALQTAASHGHDEVVRMLLERGADVNARGFKDSALVTAASRGHATTVGLLLDGGADPNVGGLLVTLSSQGYIEVIKVLLAHDADISILAESGRTALQEAASHGHEEIIRLFLEKGVDVNARGGPGEALCNLRKSEMYDLRNISGTALLDAVFAGNEEVVRLLLDHGAAIDAQGAEGTTLSVAAARGHIGIVKMLLDQGADIHARSGFGQTPLQEAAWGGHDEIVRVLLENGADINADKGLGLHALRPQNKLTVINMLSNSVLFENSEGTTALMNAALQGQVKTVRLLLDRGADVNARGKNGTALSMATGRRRNEIVGLLTDNGAETNVQVKSGTTSYGAAEGSYMEITRKPHLSSKYFNSDAKSPKSSRNTINFMSRVPESHVTRAHRVIGMGKVRSDSDDRESRSQKETNNIDDK